MSQFTSGDSEDIHSSDAPMDQVRVQYLQSLETITSGAKAVLDLQKTPIIRLGNGLFRFLVLSWLVMGIYFVFFPPKDRPPGTASPAPFLLGISGLILGLGLLRRCSMRWTICRRLSRLAEKDRWISWTITPDDIETRDHLATVRLKWARFTEAVEQRNGFLFMLDLKQGLFLPAIAFTWPEEARYVSDWARRRVTKYRKRQAIEIQGKPEGPSFNDEL
jgi:hypothetical protein